MFNAVARQRGFSKKIVHNGCPRTSHDDVKMQDAPSMQVISQTVNYRNALPYIDSHTINIVITMSYCTYRFIKCKVYSAHNTALKYMFSLWTCCKYLLFYDDGYFYYWENSRILILFFHIFLLKINICVWSTVLYNSGT